MWIRGIGRGQCHTVENSSARPAQGVPDTNHQPWPSHPATGCLTTRILLPLHFFACHLKGVCCSYKHRCTYAETQHIHCLSFAEICSLHVVPWVFIVLRSSVVILSVSKEYTLTLLAGESCHLGQQYHITWTKFLEAPAPYPSQYDGWSGLYEMSGVIKVVDFCHANANLKHCSSMYFPIRSR